MHDDKIDTPPSASNQKCGTIASGASPSHPILPHHVKPSKEGYRVQFWRLVVMDVTFLVAWQWFQWIAIRFAIFMGLLTLGPSIGLIVFDLLLYAYRTTFDGVVFIGKLEKEMPSSSETNKDEIEEEVAS